MADGGDERPERPWCGQYVLKGHEPVPEYDLMTWARWYEEADRHVASTRIGCLRLSTIFLGLDHNLGGESPTLFETMIFYADPRRRGRRRGFRPFSEFRHRKSCARTSFNYQARYATWDESEIGHWRVFKEVQRASAHKIRFEKLDDPFGEYEKWRQEYGL